MIVSKELVHNFFLVDIFINEEYHVYNVMDEEYQWRYAHNSPLGCYLEKTESIEKIVNQLDSKASIGII